MALPPLAPAQQPPAVRYAVPISRVASALAEKSVDLPPDRIHLPPAITSSVPQPTLRLVAAELRQDDALSLRLACRTSSECLPFFAIVSMPDHAEALIALNALRGSFNTGADTGAARTQHRTGISVGNHVTLELSDRQMHIQLQGIAIDTGEPGHEIRVASLDRRHTYHGIVVDPNTVKGDLP